MSYCVVSNITIVWRQLMVLDTVQHQCNARWHGVGRGNTVAIQVTYEPQPEQQYEMTPIWHLSHFVKGPEKSKKV